MENIGCQEYTRMNEDTRLNIQIISESQWVIKDEDYSILKNQSELTLGVEII